MKKLSSVILLVLAGCASKPHAYLADSSLYPQALQICTVNENVQAMENYAITYGCRVPTSIPYVTQPDNCIFYKCEGNKNEDDQP